MFYDESNNYFQRDDGFKLTPSQYATWKKKEELKANKSMITCEILSTEVR